MAVPVAYLDECVDVWVVEALAVRGFPATAAVRHGMLTKSDAEQLQFATDAGYVLVTHNRRDYVRLNAQWRVAGRDHADIVAIPSTSAPDQMLIRIAMLLTWLRDLPAHETGVFSWGDLQFQMTQGFRLDGFSGDDVRLALGQAR